MDDLGAPLCSETPNYSSKRFSTFDPSQEAESSGVQLDVREPDGWMGGSSFFMRFRKSHEGSMEQMYVYLYHIWYKLDILPQKGIPGPFEMKMEDVFLMHSKLPKSIG